MMRGVKLMQEHLDRFQVQDRQKVQYEDTRFWCLLQSCMDPRSRNDAWALLDGDEPVALFLLIDADGAGRVTAYTILSRNLGTRRLLRAAKEARQWLYSWGGYRRVEAYCDADDGAEQYWCEKVLGMSYEGVLKSFTPDGRDIVVFAKVSDGY